MVRKTKRSADDSLASYPAIKNFAPDRSALQLDDRDRAVRQEGDDGHRRRAGVGTAVNQSVRPPGSASRVEFHRAGWTSPSLSHARHYELERSYVLVLIAICTRIMRWPNTTFRWLQYVGERTESNILKPVALALTFPCFHLSQFSSSRTRSIRSA
jgi:hypothetical protein